MSEFLTREEFVAVFKEFDGIDTTVVDARLEEAKRRTPAAVWKTKTKDAQGWLAAHLLAISPHGQNARLANDKGESPYLAERQRMELEVAAGAAPRTL